MPAIKFGWHFSSVHCRAHEISIDLQAKSMNFHWFPSCGYISMNEGLRDDFQFPTSVQSSKTIETCFSVSQRSLMMISVHTEKYFHQQSIFMVYFLTMSGWGGWSGLGRSSVRTLLNKSSTADTLTAGQVAPPAKAVLTQPITLSTQYPRSFYQPMYLMCTLNVPDNYVPCVYLICTRFV